MGFSKKPTDNRAADSAPASASAEDPSSSSSLSFFSRFALPLRSRARYVADFHIRPAEPHRKYGAGDQVQGAVVLTVVKPVRITHLVVSLHGYMRVYKGPSAPANEPIIDPAEAFATSSRSSRQKNPGNGCVRLFQDEQTLSGDGRLEPGKYEFNFNLLFPAYGLPSSIDFERGTISYMITATLTRPTSIGTKTPPKSSCERKVYLVEKLDIGSLAPPRPRTIYLEPISKRPKRKKQPVVVSVEKDAVPVDTIAPASDLDWTRANGNSTEGSLSVIGEDLEQEPTGNNPRSPQSDVRSVSSESAVSHSTGQSKAGDANPGGPIPASLCGKKAPVVKERTITATVELPKGGCLRGDMVPIKISVQHIRRIKSMHGVIVTLYRLGRIDSSPPLLSKKLPEAEARRLEKEDYFPRSKTGLGGLSLTSAGSCSVFRKDLSQAFAPLIIDPDTLTASLTASVRVPEDVFPTIKGAPYDMISFKYHVEVIVDLGGKLANQIHGIKPSGTRMSPVAGPLGATGSPYEGGPATMTSWGTSIIDTDSLRRQKGVICVVFEVVVGTADSSRLRAKAPIKPDPSVHTVAVQETEMYDGGRNEKQTWPTAPGDDHGYPPDDYPQDYTPSLHAHPPYPYWDASPPQPPPAPHYVPTPDITDESSLTEKERIRRAEQRLLPSQPPAAPASGPSNSRATNGENIYDADDQIPTPVAGPSRDPGTPHPTQPDVFGAPSAPTLEDLSPGGEGHPAEDKQELERRRLLAEASAPPEFPEDYDNGGSSSAAASALPAGPSAPPGHDLQPSAPVLEDEDAYGPHYAYGSVAEASPLPAPVNSTAPEEPLPKYER
ncbi:hypothetical protein C8A01DRAFT_32948 [Parachaetomium inaequale]|uniref:Arrestin C-terminal-like domain-containing protein n=1 Tax=Parachaetomium inaequale TaxID=2588326 RepID=A0AAN6PNB4_9PEZI|nr:hypothetical protein C8A01DRAFT_32948 [Parachaetomium inaequale]